jgi:hypothetical protein
LSLRLRALILRRLPEESGKRALGSMSLASRLMPQTAATGVKSKEVLKNADFTCGSNPRCCCGCGFLNRTSTKHADCSAVFGLCVASFWQGAWYLNG